MVGKNDIEGHQRTHKWTNEQTDAPKNRNYARIKEIKDPFTAPRRTGIRRLKRNRQPPAYKKKIL